MPYNAKNLISALSSDQQYAIAYLDGLDLNGQEIGNSFGSLTKESTGVGVAATYSGTGSAKKWGTATSLTTGGTVTYSFDSGSNWTAAEQNTFKASLALWSDIADISFSQVADASTAQLVFYAFGTTTFDTKTWGTQADGAFHSD